MKCFSNCFSVFVTVSSHTYVIFIHILLFTHIDLFYKYMTSCFLYLNVLLKSSFDISVKFFLSKYGITNSHFSRLVNFSFPLFLYLKQLLFQVKYYLKKIRHIYNIFIFRSLFLFKLTSIICI